MIIASHAKGFYVPIYDAGGEEVEFDDDGNPITPATCWSCQKEWEHGQGLGVSLDETEDEQICQECWAMITPTSRMVLGLLFRRISHGGLGLADLIEEALRSYPMSITRRGEGRN